jgi:hypothetical protein
MSRGYRNRVLRTICDIADTEPLLPSSAVHTLTLHSPTRGTDDRVREEYERLYDEYVVMRLQAQRLGEMMCEIGLALRDRPESIVVRPSPRETVAASAMVLTSHPPTLLAIERLATDMRSAMDRLTELKQLLPPDHEPNE